MDRRASVGWPQTVANSQRLVPIRKASHFLTPAVTTSSPSCAQVEPITQLIAQRRVQKRKTKQPRKEPSLISGLTR